MTNRTSRTSATVGTLAAALTFVVAPGRPSRADSEVFVPSAQATVPPARASASRTFVYRPAFPNWEPRRSNWRPTRSFVLNNYAGANYPPALRRDPYSPTSARFRTGHPFGWLHGH